MLSHTLAVRTPGASWKVALLALLALAGFLLPVAAEAQQPTQTVIILRGTGTQVTDRAQIGDRCTPGARALVHAKIAGEGGGATVTGTARCGGATAAALAHCTATDTSAARDTCNAAGSQPAGGLAAECAAAYVKARTTSPDSIWKVTCIFNL